MRKIVAFVFVFFLLGIAKGQFKQVVTKSSITFSIKNFAFTAHGSFSGLKADIIFDPANPGISKILASVQSATINTDNGTRDKHLKKEDYFDVEKYPVITMRSASLKHIEGENYSGDFNVTIKDKTTLITVPFTYRQSAKTAAFKGQFKIVRADFGIGGKGLILGDEATVTVEIETGIEQ